MANEFSVIVPSGSTGIYGIIIKPGNKAQGYNVSLNDGSTYKTLNRTDAAQKVSFSSAISMGTFEEQYASLPSGLSVNKNHVMKVFDSSSDLIDTIEYKPQDEGVSALLVAIKAKTDYIVTAVDGMAISTFFDKLRSILMGKTAGATGVAPEKEIFYAADGETPMLEITTDENHNRTIVDLDP